MDRLFKIHFVSNILIIYPLLIHTTTDIFSKIYDVSLFFITQLNLKFNSTNDKALHFMDGYQNFYQNYFLFTSNMYYKSTKVK